MVGCSGGVAVFRCGMGATASLDADSGTPGAPCGQQVLGAHNDVGAGAGGKPAGADCEKTRTAGMGDDVTGIGKLGHLSPVHSDPRSPFDGAKGGCLLYTSDAADEEDSVDLGGRRIIKKKKKK